MASGKLTANDDPEVWAKAFNEFGARNNVAFEDVAAWFREAIEAGANAQDKILKTIEAMQAEVTVNNIDKGWFDEPHSFGDCMANLTGEVSEAWEAWRKWGLEDKTSGVEHLIGCDVWEKWEGPCNCNAVAKPEGVGSEFADIFIRLLDDCERFKVNLREEYERKMIYNRTRPYRHGDKRA